MSVSYNALVATADAHLRLDGSGSTVLDTSGNGRHFTANTAPAETPQPGVPQWLASSRRIAGGLNNVIFNNNDSPFRFERDQPFSYGVWVFPFTLGNSALFSKMLGQSPYRGYDLFVLDSGQVRAHIIHAWDSNAIAVDGPTLRLNDWNHVLATYDGSSTAAGVKLYHDGVEFSNTSIVNDNLAFTIVDTQPPRIGQRANNANRSNAQFNEFFIKGTELTAVEVSELVSGPEPLNTVAPTLSGTEEVGETLTSTTGTWDSQSNGTLSYTYQWTRSDDASGTNEADISGATSSTYTLVSADETKFIRCRVRASNDGGFDSAEDTNTGFTGAIASGGGATVAVGTATETDTANAVTVQNPRSYTVGTASETDTANSVTVQQAQAVSVGTATETNTANAVSVLNPRTYSVGTASETETANSVSVANPRTYSVGTASETDTANAVTITNDQTVVVGTASESCVANSVSVLNPRAYTVGRATEVSIGRAVTILNPRTFTVGTASETDTANAASVISGATTAGFVKIRNATLKTGYATATLRTGRATATLKS